jgi:hypothetical protein
VTPFDEFVEFQTRQHRRDVVADVFVLQDLAYPIREEKLLAIGPDEGEYLADYSGDIVLMSPSGMVEIPRL